MSRTARRMHMIGRIEEKPSMNLVMWLPLLFALWVGGMASFIAFLKAARRSDDA